MEYELVIRNGTVIDGTGSAGFTADVAVSEGQIVAVGDVPWGWQKRNRRNWPNSHAGIC